MGVGILPVTSGATGSDRGGSGGGRCGKGLVPSIVTSVSRSTSICRSDKDSCDTAGDEDQGENREVGCWASSESESHGVMVLGGG